MIETCILAGLAWGFCAMADIRAHANFPVTFVAFALLLVIVGFLPESPGPGA